MANEDGNINYEGTGYMGDLYPMKKPMLSQQSSSSTSGMPSNYSSPPMMPQGQNSYPYIDPMIPSRMMSPVVPQNSEWYSAGMMPNLNTSINMMADLELSLSAGANISPVPSEDMHSRRESIASNPEVAEWQDRVRAERRKVQNRAAQRAYRERKEKAISDLRELLEQKETQYKALQSDHSELRQQYEKLRAAKQDDSGLNMMTTCDPSELLTRPTRMPMPNPNVPPSAPAEQ